MKKIHYREICALVSIILVCVYIGLFPLDETALSKYGSRGDEVYKIQQRLTSWGITAAVLTVFTVGGQFRQLKTFSKKMA